VLDELGMAGGLSGRDRLQSLPDAALEGCASTHH
jgi:hypothetical protein